MLVGFLVFTVGMASLYLGVVGGTFKEAIKGFMDGTIIVAPK